MKRLIFIVLIITSSYNVVKSQKLTYTSDLNPISTYFPNFENFKVDYDSVSQIPLKYMNIVNSQLKSRTKGHYKNFTFHSAIEIDVDKYLSKYPNSIYTLNGQVSKFNIVYEWKDLSLGIDLYYVLLSIDPYGQITRFNFPDLNLSKNNKLASLDEAKNIADEYMGSRMKQFNKFTPSLVYKHNKKQLYWQIYYKSTKKKEQNTFYMCEMNVTYKYCDGYYRGYFTPYEIIEENELDDKIIKSNNN